MIPLKEFKSNSYSQKGEDGLISEILRRIALSYDLNLWCCELGAWDGKYLSNCAKLIEEHQYRAVLIEADKKRFKELEINFPLESIIKLNSYVTTQGETSLDRILTQTHIPINFDFLSIDVDGMDYHILNSLQIFRPKLICVEFNGTIPNSVNFVQSDNPKIKQGSSAKAIWQLATSKQYTPIAATDWNLFLLDNYYLSLFSEDIESIESMIPKGNDPQIIFSGYDGSILSNKPHISLGWHGDFPLQKIQIIPKNLRNYSGYYNLTQRKLFKIFFWLKRGRLIDIINSEKKLSKIRMRIKTLLKQLVNQAL